MKYKYKCGSFETIVTASTISEARTIGNEKHKKETDYKLTQSYAIVEPENNCNHEKGLCVGFCEIEKVIKEGKKLK